MRFQDVSGQHALKTRLAGMVGSNRIGHALLFIGKEGSGALPLAVALASYLLCEKRRGPAEATASLFGGLEEPTPPLQDACGTCATCRKTAQYAHPDLHFSYPVVPRKQGDKPIATHYIAEWRKFLREQPYGNLYDWLQSIDAENRQGNIPAAECEDIQHKLYLKSFEGGLRILVLWMPEYLGKEGNKLLKLMEEPPEDTLFLLVAENESEILPTIVSRTQVIRVPPLSPGDITNALLALGDISTAKARQLAAAAGGNLREALAWARAGDGGEDWESLLRDWLNAIMKGGPVAQLNWVEDVSKLGRENQKQMLRYFSYLLGQTIAFIVHGSIREGSSESEADFVQRLARIAGLAELEAMAGAADQYAYYIERNANARMLFHALTIRVARIIKDKSVILSA